MTRRISDNRASVLERLDKIEQAINNNGRRFESQDVAMREAIEKLAIDTNRRLSALEQTPLKRLLARLTRTKKP